MQLFRPLRQPATCQDCPMGNTLIKSQFLNPMAQQEMGGSILATFVSLTFPGSQTKKFLSGDFLACSLSPFILSFFLFFGGGELFKIATCLRKGKRFMQAEEELEC